MDYSCAFLTRQPNEIANAGRVGERRAFGIEAGAERNCTAVAALINWKLLLWSLLYNAKAWLERPYRAVTMNTYIVGFLPFFGRIFLATSISPNVYRPLELNFEGANFRRIRPSRDRQGVGC